MPQKSLINVVIQRPTLRCEIRVIDMDTTSNVSWKHDSTSHREHYEIREKCRGAA